MVAESQRSILGWVPVAFGLVAVGFVYGPDRADVPIPPAAEVALEDLGRGPLRTPMSIPPTIEVMGGFMKQCNDCHEKYVPPRNEYRTELMHEQVVVVHGARKRCLDCHDPDNRNRLNIGGTDAVAFDESEKMCAKCHGPRYRSWKAGVHGKAVGSWDTMSDKRRLMTCIECHDPHKPRLARIKTLPSPKTLRMGEPEPERPAPRTNPLMPEAAGVPRW